MRDWLLDHFLERSFGPGRTLPRWLRALLDETFLWVAIGQLLLALGVRPASVRRLSEVQALLEEARTVFGEAGYEIPRLEGLHTYQDLERFEERMADLEDLHLTPEELDSIVPAPVAVDRLQSSALIVLGLLEEVLGAVRARRLRTELIGLDHQAATALISRVRRGLERLDLEDAAQKGYVDVARRLELFAAELDLGDGAALETRPVAPRIGEVGRIVSVIREIPRPTLDRLLPLRLLSSRLVLTTAITKALEGLRRDWVPPAERTESATEDLANAERARQRRWRRHDERCLREVVTRDAQPRARRSLRTQTVLLWVLNAVCGGWIALWTLGAFGADPLGGLGQQSTIMLLWPGPSAAVALVTFLLAGWSSALDPVDRVELVRAGRRAIAEATPARRARARAVRVALVLSSVVVFLSIVVAPVVEPSFDLPWEPFASWHDVGEGEIWRFLAAMGLPAGAAIAGIFIGGSRGSARAKRLRPPLDPEPVSGSRNPAI